MPELPEVHTTVEGLKKEVVGKTIESVWSDFHIATAHGHRNNLKNLKYYKIFKRIATGSKIVSAERLGKNIIINLSNRYSIVVHMKMTGHLMIGKYEMKNPTTWIAIEKGPLQDSYNQFLHFVVTLNNDKRLVLSDMRKFASVCIVETDKLKEHESLSGLGKDATLFSQKEFEERVLSQSQRKKSLPIKTLLMNQSVIAGIGNIYSDESLWEAGVHPLSKPLLIPKEKFVKIYQAMQKILKFSIKNGGDSKSDYRNIYGEKGGFQDFHKAYGRKGEKCHKKGCAGIIERTVVNGRSAHFCPKHQKLYK